MTAAEFGDEWLPLELPESEVESFTALRADIPPWLRKSLWGWIFGRFTTRHGNSIYERFDDDLARSCERKLQVLIQDAGPLELDEGLRAIDTIFGKSAIATWQLVDFLVSSQYSGAPSVRKLDQMLAEAKSVWKVGNRIGTTLGLVRRLPEGVQTGAEAVFRKPNAGKRLATAWENAFGIKPDPSKAYWFAVKAVEDASAPVVIPNDPAPTLGKVISRMEQGGQYRLPHLREDGRAKTHDVLLGMLRMLWVGQYDRHGGLPESPLPDDVTPDEAEAAVMLAVTLVGWFETGKIQQ